MSKEVQARLFAALTSDIPNPNEKVAGLLQAGGKWLAGNNVRQFAQRGTGLMGGAGLGAVGALGGAAVGAIGAGEGNRMSGALGGAAIGGTLGGVGGYRAGASRFTPERWAVAAQTAKISPAVRESMRQLGNNRKDLLNWASKQSSINVAAVKSKLRQLVEQHPEFADTAMRGIGGAAVGGAIGGGSGMLNGYLAGGDGEDGRTGAIIRKGWEGAKGGATLGAGLNMIAPAFKEQGDDHVRYLRSALGL